MKLEEVKKYMDENDKRPSTEDKNKEVKKLGNWISSQLKNYKKVVEIMTNEEIRKKWNEFIEDPKYSKYFLSNEEIWNMKLEEVKKYIDDNNKKPSSLDKNKEIKTLRNWISSQITNYKKGEQAMSIQKIRDKWTEFIEDPKYSKYFLSNEEIWNMKLQEVKKYIDENNKKPYEKDKNKEIKILGKWFRHQIENYRKGLFIMSNQEIRDKWSEFIEDPKYSKYFLSNEEIWNMKLQEVKKYIDENNKKPHEKDKNEEIKQLGRWIGRQIKNYKQVVEIMKNKEIRDKWSEFIEDPKYSKHSKHFLSNEEIWILKLEEVKKYISDNNKKPSNSDKNEEIKQLGKWISHQIGNYKKKAEIMKNKEIRDKWSEFIEDPKYSKYFLSNEEIWILKIEEVKKYINDNNKKPSNSDKNKEIKQLGSWISNQLKNYKKEVYIMSNQEIRKKWTYFIEDPKYSKYFLKI